MRVNGIIPFVPNVYKQQNVRKQQQNNNNNIYKINQNAQIFNYPRPYFISFGDKEIKPAKRLETSDYKISKYIAEIGKARYFYGDRAVVDMSMGNPDLTPPEKSKQALQDKVNDLWSHRYNNPKGDGALFLRFRIG